MRLTDTITEAGGVDNFVNIGPFSGRFLPTRIYIVLDVFADSIADVQAAVVDNPATALADVTAGVQLLGGANGILTYTVNDDLSFIGPIEIPIDPPVLKGKYIVIRVQASSAYNGWVGVG